MKVILTCEEKKFRSLEMYQSKLHKSYDQRNYINLIYVAIDRKRKTSFNIGKAERFKSKTCFNLITSQYMISGTNI